MRSLDVFESRDLGRFRPRDSGSLTRMFPVLFPCDYYCTGMSHGDPPRLSFVMLTFSRLCLLLICTRL